MVLRPIPALSLALVFFQCAERGGQSQAEPNGKFQQLLTRIAPTSPDPCESPSIANDDALKTEFSIFEQAATVVKDALNSGAAGSAEPKDRAEDAMKKLEALSHTINADWPAEDRLHYQLLDLSAVVVLKVTFGTQARFFVFGVPRSTLGKPDQSWQQVGSDDISFEHNSPRSWLDLYPLQRGPSGRARFLVGIGFTGCAGSSGLLYEAYEWNPNNGGSLDEIINQSGSVGMDEAFDGHRPTPRDPFAPVGILKTNGSIITLPYCWFSAVDTWDNPSLCAVDAFDLSGDDVKFQSRAYNRPDLVSIAKAIEYAKKRDYPAVLGYCASRDVAQRLVRDGPPLLGGEEPRVFQTAKGKEKVEFGAPPESHFDVERRMNRWVVVSFGTN